MEFESKDGTLCRFTFNYSIIKPQSQQSGLLYINIISFGAHASLQ